MNYPSPKQEMTDYLTGLPNGKHFRASFGRAFARSWSTSAEVGLLLLDIDDFMIRNHCFGHSRGDAALTELASIVKDTLRQTYVARVGGDEFMALFEGASLQDVARQACSLVEAIDAAKIRVLESAEAANHALAQGDFADLARQPLAITVGVAVSPTGRTWASSDLIRLVDARLCSAKRRSPRAGSYVSAGRVPVQWVPPGLDQDAWPAL